MPSTRFVYRKTDGRRLYFCALFRRNVHVMSAESCLVLCLADFDRLVLKASHERLVLMDFWAEFRAFMEQYLDQW